MNFENKLISGQFVKRYKRFFVDVKINGKIITAHCPNTGSMYGLLKKGNKVWLTKSKNPNRKLKYTNSLLQKEEQKETEIVSDIANTKTKKVFSKLTEQISDILNYNT